MFLLPFYLSKSCPGLRTSVGNTATARQREFPTDRASFLSHTQRHGTAQHSLPRHQTFKSKFTSQDHKGSYPCVFKIGHAHGGLGKVRVETAGGFQVSFPMNSNPQLCDCVARTSPPWWLCLTSTAPLRTSLMLNMIFTSSKSDRITKP